MIVDRKGTGTTRRGSGRVTVERRLPPVVTASDYDVVPPRPAAMIESARAFGYELTTAIADIVDNSLSARATEISIDLFWDGAHSWIRIRDDGDGMLEEGLVAAMRLGSRSPLQERDASDLGRFGLGLKTASFSQCRRVTVRSRARGSAAATRCWDLDIVQERSEWALVRGALDERANELLGDSGSDGHGTVVLWEHLDRVVPHPDYAKAKDRFLEQVDAVAAHLAMVFHRYLAGPRRVRMQVNGRAVAPWDPFLTDEPATQVLPEETFGSGYEIVRVQPYVLPHESKLSRAAHTAAGGPGGWNAQQGFYIYRNRRLLVPGGWLGFFVQEEHNKLARVQVDISNSLDLAWQIDVRKASARPPAATKDWLRGIARKTREQAKRVYGHRGTVLARKQHEEATPVWQEVQQHGTVFYRLNRQHPWIAALLSASSVAPRDVADLVRLVEETVPVNLITSRFNEGSLSQRAPFEGADLQVNSLIRDVAIRLYSTGLDREAVIACLLRMEPFAHYPAAVAALPSRQMLQHSTGALNDR